MYIDRYLRHIAGFFILPFLLIASVAFAAGVKPVDSAEAKRLLEKNPKIFLLDVRTPDEFRQAHLKNAVLIPVSEIERRVAEIPRNRPVLVYCAVGGRSRQAAQYLAGQGFAEVYDMTDGIVGWWRSGFPVVR